MINPSTTGWIEKFISNYYLPEPLSTIDDAGFYSTIRKTGFIYGHVVAIPTREPLSFKDSTTEEIIKIALLNSLYGIFEITTKKSDEQAFIEALLDFYTVLQPESFSFLKKILPTENHSIRLEKIINERVKTNDNIINKNFSHIVTNALLFIDVLAFQKFLLEGALSSSYLRKFEETIVNTVALALKNKSKKTQYDDLLIKLFESSVRYTKYSNSTIDSLSKIDFSAVKSPLEKYYILDLVGMALWSDAVLEPAETQFFNEIGLLFQLNPDFIADSYFEIDFFIKKHKKEIPYSCEVVVTSFKEEPTILRIATEIYVERVSQRAIIIGHKGENIKKVGIQAREDLEKFFGKKVFLEQFVKVEPDWRAKTDKLRSFGYSLD